MLPPKADCEPQRYIREFRLEAPAQGKVGQVLTAAEVFTDVTNVDVTGTGGTGHSERVFVADRQRLLHHHVNAMSSAGFDRFSVV